MAGITAIPRVMTIAGSDSGGGAGIQADLKTFAALGVYGTTILTAVTAQNTQEVTEVHEIPPEIVSAQIDAVLTDIGSDAVKTGMLSSKPIIEAVAEQLGRHAVQNLVVDPVMIAKSGARLLRSDAVDSLLTCLLPLATVVTPNVLEAEVLARMTIETSTDAERAARRIVELGATAVVLKGGHLAGPAIDRLYDGKTLREFSSPRVDTNSTHGTGCTFASAIAAGLAQGLSLVEAVGLAKNFVTGALRAAYPVGRGHGPVNHFFDIMN